MECNLVINKKKNIDFNYLEMGHKYLTYHDLREQGDIGVVGKPTYNFFYSKDEYNVFFMNCLQESIKRVIKDCKYLIDTYNLEGPNKTSFEQELGINDKGKYQITKGKLIKMKKIYQKLLAETKAPPKPTPSPAPKEKSPSVGGGRHNKTRKYKILPRVSSLKKINRNTNLNYTL